jgi:hypothetical protein
MNQVFKIGRNINNNLVLKDKLAEEFHAEIYFKENNELHLLDLKSKYGCLVNGLKVRETILQKGDSLQIGFSIIDWEAIKKELQKTFLFEKEKVIKPIYTEVETNYTGQATHQLAIEALNSFPLKDANAVKQEVLFDKTEATLSAPKVNFKSEARVIVVKETKVDDKPISEVKPNSNKNLKLYLLLFSLLFSMFLIGWLIGVMIN